MNNEITFLDSFLPANMRKLAEEKIEHSFIKLYDKFLCETVAWALFGTQPAIEILKKENRDEKQTAIVNDLLKEQDFYTKISALEIEINSSGLVLWL